MWLFLGEVFPGQIVYGRVKAEAHSCLSQRALLLPWVLEQTLENVYGTNYVLLSSWFIFSNLICRWLHHSKDYTGSPLTVWGNEVQSGLSPVTNPGLGLEVCTRERILSEQPVNPSCHLACLPREDFQLSLWVGEIRSQVVGRSGEEGTQGQGVAFLSM